MAALRWIYRHILNSVPFGISLLGLVALYIAIGSGVAGLRERLEMDELLFFNWWPFKLLIVVLAVNLMTVTIIRIPLTPPRYGVWAIHLGIILLLISLGAYYRLKVEGLVPLVRGQTATSFYDRWERSLYVRTPYAINGVALEGLPRFGVYDDASGNASRLDRPTLRNLEPQLAMLDAKTNQSHITTLGEAIGAEHPVTLDIVGYYPYAEPEGWVLDPAANNTGLKLSSDGHSSSWIVASESAKSVIPVSDRAFIEHRHMPSVADVEVAIAAAKKLHKLEVRIGETSRGFEIEPGQTHELVDAGYSFLIEGFTPQFTLSSKDAAADAITLLVTQKKPDGTTYQYRRMILSGRDSQTDFELGVDGAGPFGKRKSDGLLDTGIHFSYVYSDPTRLLPTMDGVTAKYILYTASDAPGITSLRVSSRAPSSVTKSSDGHLDLIVQAPSAMFNMGAADQPLNIHVDRHDNVKRSDGVVVVPPERRDNDAARAGAGQMVRVKVTSGDWSQIVPVSFDQFALQNPFRGATIKVPGAEVPFQLMLGNLRRPLPVAVRLENFEATPYAGGEVSGNAMMREFKSNITFLDQARGTAIRASASLNKPAFYKRGGGGLFVPSESWIFSQASWNPQDLDFTALQVGNRPFVGNMMFACGLIFGGLLYAFYLKPIIIRRMKAKALRDAQNRRNSQRTQRDETQELVTSA